MPKYEYACKSCGEHMEVVQSFADAALTECPSCTGPLRKVYGAPGISFKGSGFYRTDNRKRRSEPKETKADATSDSGSKAESGSTSESGSKSELGSDSKAGSKSESGSDSKPTKKETASEPKAKAKGTEAKTA